MPDENQSEPVNGQHNAKALKDMRRECAALMREIQAERKDLNERAGDIRERLRDNGIDVKAFMAALRLIDMEDASARDVYLDELRMSFEDLGAGQQLDWVESVTGEANKPNSGPAPTEQPAAA